MTLKWDAATDHWLSLLSISSISHSKILITKLISLLGLNLISNTIYKNMIVVQGIFFLICRLKIPQKLNIPLAFKQKFSKLVIYDKIDILLLKG